jgi:outer membrane protein TolC
VKAGAARRGEQLTTQADLARAHADLERAREALRLARERLGFAAGARIDGELMRPEEPTRGSLALEPMLDRALGRRPDLLALQELVVARREQIETLKRDRFPDVDLSANVYPLRDGGSEDVNWDLAVTAEVPLYRSGRWLTSLRQAESAERQARLAVQEQRRRIDLDLREAVLEIQGSDALLVALNEQVTASEEAYRQVKREFDAGAASNLEVTVSQTQLLGAQLDRDTESLRNTFLYRRLWALTGDFLAADLESGVTR